MVVGLCLTFTASLYAQNTQPERLDTVWIDSKVPVARKNSGKVVVTISNEVLAQSRGKSVAQVINEVSGIEINGSRSNDGQTLGYFIRGGRNRQVVILVDGVAMNDASSIANDYDLRLLSASDVDRIDILKGASSVLYGSGAATAVISITTKQESDKKISGRFTSTLGTNRASGDDGNNIEELTNQVTVSGTVSKFTYKAQFANRYTSGLSAIEAGEGEPDFEADDFNRYNARADVGYRISDGVEVRRFFGLDHFTAEFDDFSFVDADNRSMTEQLRTGGSFNWNYGKGKVVINDVYTKIEREIQSSFPTRLDARTYNFDAYVNHRFDNLLNLVVGVNGNFSNFNSFSIPFGETDFAQDVDKETATFDIIDPYVNLVFISEFGLQVNAGARLNNHSNYGSNFVYHVNPSYVFDAGNTDIKILSSYSTAYITPSLFQLYDPSFGNTELQPEENSTIEAGLEVSQDDNFRISAIYFNRNESNFVDFITVDPDLFVFQYQNISEDFSASGIEVEVSKRLGEKVRLAGNYTYTKPDDRFALRIPEHKANASVNYQPNAKTQVGISYQYNAEREDSFFNPDTFEAENVTLDSFGTLDLTGGYQISEVVRIFANVSNLLDEEYEELYRFQTRGRNVRLGFELSL